jgi:hypothetical protein
MIIFKSCCRTWVSLRKVRMTRPMWGVVRARESFVCSCKGISRIIKMILMIIFKLG